ncbi:hypothetical protein [Nonomuraea rhodomycinica]|uniref:Secreted protein n=1 Tax=Nonomuraea rhodomycinica TaxID=1712872 RepID=A0A7Y6ILF6_9ACTN|nr:hypothetical protein [Nonomuraea rhodomycinica]NUW39893.1 hypothetical protein [Nonomuraea rhodomycinica]
MRMRTVIATAAAGAALSFGLAATPAHAEGWHHFGYYSTQRNCITAGEALLDAGDIGGYRCVSVPPKWDLQIYVIDV